MKVLANKSSSVKRETVETVYGVAELEPFKHPYLKSLMVKAYEVLHRHNKIEVNDEGVSESDYVEVHCVSVLKSGKPGARGYEITMPRRYPEETMPKELVEFVDGIVPNYFRRD